MAVLLREVVAVAVDDVLEVHANRQRWDSVPVGADLLASGKPARMRPVRSRSAATTPAADSMPYSQTRSPTFFASKIVMKEK
jgi:hypothetical protein